MSYYIVSFQKHQIIGLIALICLIWGNSWEQINKHN